MLKNRSNETISDKERGVLKDRDSKSVAGPDRKEWINGSMVTRTDDDDDEDNGDERTRMKDEG